MNTTQILSGHTSPETAYLVEDYPYGFRLRCRIRYWLEYAPKKGFRLWSQTSNPKRGNVWNKPKASTFQRFAGAMFLDDKGHITWTGLNEYADLPELIAWRNTYAHTMPAEAQKFLKYWITRKLDFEQRKIEGQITSTMRCQKYTPLSQGLQPEGPAEVQTEVLTSKYTTDQLNAWAESLRQPTDTGALAAKVGGQ